MRKWIVLIITTVMIFALAACGEEKDTGNKEPQSTNSSSQQKTENIVADEELVGTWISKDGTCFTIKADGTVTNETRDFCITFTSDSKYVPWKVEGNHFIFQEAAGSVLKYEIIKQNDQLKLKYLEMTEGGFVAGIMVEEFMTELTKQPTSTAVLETDYVTGVWVWQEDKSSGLTSTRSFELYADGTGKILSSTKKENENATFEWHIEETNDILRWSSVSVSGFGGYDLQLSDNYLSDITGSDFFLKEKE